MAEPEERCISVRESRGGTSWSHAQKMMHMRKNHKESGSWNNYAIASQMGQLLLRNFHF